MQSLNRLLLPLRYTYFHPKYQRFIAEFRAFRRLSEDRPKRFEVRWKDRFSCLDDRMPVTPISPLYTYHPAWAARIVAETRPAMHVDIGSTLLFSTMISAFVPVEFYDIRPAQLTLKNLVCKRADVTALGFGDDSIMSLSCMHVVEHVGLGRYGDALNPEGDLKAIGELKRVLARGGSLLFVAPVGRPALHFNAQHIYSYEQVTSYFDGLETRQFSLIDDRGNFVEHAEPLEADRQQFGCGCWWFVK